MTLFVVGYMNDFENDMILELIDAENWKEALSFHSSMRLEDGSPDDNSWLSDDIEEAKKQAFDADFHFEVMEMPESIVRKIENLENEKDSYIDINEI